MRMLIRIPALLALILASISVMSAKALAAEDPDLGVMAINQPSGTDFDRMGTAGLDVYRMNLSWAAVQHYSADNFNWNGWPGHGYDDIVCNAARNGIAILPTVFSSPGWANGGKSPEKPPTAQHRDEFGEFIAAAAERYGVDGTIWADPESPCAGLTPKPITTWQIWNEPNLTQYWGSRASAKAYKPLLVAARTALQPSGGRVAVAGLANGPSRSKNSKYGMAPEVYLKQLYQSGARPFFDIVSAHPYHADPRLMLKTLERYRNVMSHFGDRGKPLWVSEFGWASGGPRSQLTVKPKVQAAYLEQSIQMVRKSPGLRVTAMLWYAFRDVPFREVSPPSVEDSWIYHSGLFTSKGVAKPAWKTLAKLAGGSPF